MKKIFEKQLLHLIYLILSGIGLYRLSFIKGFGDGSLWGIDTLHWLYLLLGTTVIHQVYIWFCWRSELYYGLLSRWFGKKAFTVYAVIFFILIIARPILITFLAISNRGTFALNRTLGMYAAFILTVPCVYLFYSVGRYFGFQRASGIDHFDVSCRGKSLVKKGIYRYTNNGMYIFGLLILWIPSILLFSITAVAAALFSHLYVWVHYFCTEKPDMEFIYGSRDNVKNNM